MKAFKFIALISLTSLLAVNNVQAQSSQQTQQQPTSKKQQQQQQKQKQQQQKQKKNATTAEDQALAQFNQAFGIRFLGWQFAADNGGKNHIQLRYELQNKGKKDIRAVQFLGGFMHNDQIIYAQEIPLTFNTPLKAKDNIVLDISVPVEKLPQQALNIMSQPNAQVSVINGAQQLVFTDNSKIEVN